MPSIGNRTVDILDALSFQREAWEHLGFLMNEGEVKTSPHRQQQERNKIERIRSYYGRKRYAPEDRRRFY